VLLLPIEFDPQFAVSPSLQLSNQAPVLVMGAFEFFAQSLVKGIVGRHGRRARYIRQQGSMSGVHPLLGSFDLFSRGHMI